MWRNIYKDYKPDHDWTRIRVEPGQGITGCEMHEKNGWQLTYHREKKRKRKGFLFFIYRLMGLSKKK